MTKQAHSVLRKLRKAQITENGEVFINFTDMTACTCHAGNEPCVTVDLSDTRYFPVTATTYSPPIFPFLKPSGLLSANGFLLAVYTLS